MARDKSDMVHLVALSQALPDVSALDIWRFYREARLVAKWIKELPYIYEGTPLMRKGRARMQRLVERAEEMGFYLYYEVGETFPIRARINNNVFWLP